MSTSTHAANSMQGKVMISSGRSQLQSVIAKLLESNAAESWRYGIYWTLNGKELEWGGGYIKEERMASDVDVDVDPNLPRQKLFRALKSSLFDMGEGADFVEEKVTDVQFFFLKSMTVKFDHPSEGLPSRVVYTNTPIWTVGSDILSQSQCSHTRYAESVGMRTVAYIPFRYGAIEFGSTREIPFVHSTLKKQFDLLFPSAAEGSLSIAAIDAGEASLVREGNVVSDGNHITLFVTQKEMSKRLYLPISGLNFESLNHAIRRKFGLTPETSFTLAYIDRLKDEISLDSDKDVSDCITCFRAFVDDTLDVILHLKE